MDSTTIGGVTITRIPEWEGLFPMTPGQFFQGYEQASWDEHRTWLAPDHWEPRADMLRACLQPWLVRSRGKTILIDTGAGNHKERPHLAIFGGLETPFLSRLAEAGPKPEDVDIVVCTHLHVDHVGWNTTLQGSDWVPTFPNARYLFPKADWEYWNPENDSRFTRVGEVVNEGMFEDSVRPIAQAGLCDLVEGRYRIDENLTIVPAPGHTPGQSAVEVDSDGERALFVGDVIHSPAQIVRPDWNSPFCEDAATARDTRRKILDWCVDHRALLVPAHFGGGHAARITRRGGRFAIDRWADFAP